MSRNLSLPKRLLSLIYNLAIIQIYASLHYRTLSIATQDLIYLFRVRTTRPDRVVVGRVSSERIEVGGSRRPLLRVCFISGTGVDAKEMKAT